MSEEFKRISGLLNVRSNRIAETISESISYRDAFTYVSDADPQNIASKGLTLVSLNLSGHHQSELYLCIVTKNNRVATGQVRVKGYKALLLKEITVANIMAALPKKSKDRGRQYLTEDYPQFSLKFGEVIFQTLIALKPELADNINELFDQLQHKPFNGPSAREQDAAVERDALGLTLDIFGIERADVFNKWQGKGGNLGSSFLSGLKEFTVYEDDVLAHDLHSFPNFNIAKKDITGVVEFESEDGERLTVINANRKPLEKAMGVDLIYFHRRYESFVMVQYKMMDQRNEQHDSFYYNPNQQSHEDELKRLQRLRDFIEQEELEKSLNNYRLSNSTLFFKLCKKIEFKKSDHSLAPGMYIPLEEWEHLLNDNSTLGKKGGRQFGYHTLKKRYMHKDTFVNLVRSGMLGTAGNASKKIAAFIEDAIAQGHSVMYAIDERLKEPLSLKQKTKRRFVGDELIKSSELDHYIEEDDLPF